MPNAARLAHPQASEVPQGGKKRWAPGTRYAMQPTTSMLTSQDARRQGIGPTITPWRRLP